MRIGYVTLFPDLIRQALSHSIPARAQASGAASLAFASPRDHAEGVHRAVDDRPFGGGPGMVMMPHLVEAALASLQPGPGAAIILTDPSGPPFRQKDARRLAEGPEVIFVCGHYEGIDERAASIANERFSIGDYVISGGELAAAVMSDAILRLLPGVLGNSESHETDSHEDGLLGAPAYTKPMDFRGQAPPEVLRSGDHAAIARWRRREQLLRTRSVRPDLFARAALGPEDLKLLAEPAQD